MPVSMKINGVWRDLWSSQAMINGVWRDLESWVNINGVWRESFKHNIEESDIIGFRMIYKLMNVAKHPDYPKLTVNKDLPVIVTLSGKNQGKMDGSTKGILFQYSNEEYEKEGIIVYRGDLYAELATGQIVNVGMSISDVGCDVRTPGNIPGMIESWSTNKLGKLSITMNGYVLYNATGYSMAGWNSLFNKNQFIDPSDHSDQGPYKNKLQLNSYNILPIENRIDSFDSAAYIGIARDMTSDTGNMIGSHGVLDHTITAIYVDGVSKPFVVELYN